MLVPDLKFINRNVPINDVAQALNLQRSANGLWHCWRPNLHKNGDRTASVSIWKRPNTVKCFGCQIGPLKPADVVKAVLNLSSIGDAARWIAGRFDVPSLARGKHIDRPERLTWTFGFESELGLLIRSGLWAQLEPGTQRVVPVLLDFVSHNPEECGALRISFRTLMRYTGIGSPNTISGALRELGRIGWLKKVPRKSIIGGGPVRETATYSIRAKSDEIYELAHATYVQFAKECEAQRNIRSEARAVRQRQLRARTGAVE